MDANTFRDAVVSGPGPGADDLAGLVIGLGLWIFLIIAAPLVVIVLAGPLFTVELPIVLALAVLLIVARFAGVMPWHVLVIDNATGHERLDTTRSIFTAVRMVRDVNLDKRVRVRWRWM